ncbi:hypothetical protein [Streptomyces sp. MUSC 14]|uniref:hypothetical protein n=1 Tax=Streptomyces sp. MUSC 14 TaxID=1354889 RepID=UPI0015A6B06F|nr:hypothetical protein [Streptomyces sp. MUSC 14]
MTIPTAAASADSCPTPIGLNGSNIVLRVNTGFGQHSDTTIGNLYLGYFGGTCRQTYAEIRWNGSPDPASGTIYINDPFNTAVGKVNFNVPAGYTGTSTSGLISIDHDPWNTAYPYPKSFQAAAVINIDNNYCVTTIATAAHQYSTGGISGSSDTTCTTHL